MQMRLGWTLACALSLAATPASAAKKPDFLVNSTASGSDGNCTKAPGGCTLREAIEALNAKGSGSIGFDPAIFPPGSETAINTTGAGLPPILASKVSVDGTGAGVEIDAESAPSDGLVIHSGSGNPLSDVQVRAIRIKTPAGSGLSICGGEWPSDCDQPVSNVVLDRVEAQRAGLDGIEIVSGDLSKVTIKDCTGVKNGSRGIVIDAEDDLTGVTLIGNTTLDNGSNGIEIDAGTATKLKILANHTAKNDFNGISVTSTTTTGLNVQGNHAVANESGGLTFSLGSSTAVTISDNTVTANDGFQASAAVKLSANSLSKFKLERNVVTGNGIDPETALGIRIDSNNALTKAKISRNQASGNDRDGLRVESDTMNSVTIERNLAIGNGEDGLQIAAHSSASKVRISKNTLDANENSGLQVEAPNSLIDGNRASGNDDGIRLEDDADGTRVQNNVTDGNRLSGIYVDSAVTGATLQKNRARGNAEDLSDDSGDCINNTWKQNDFGTNDPACIQ